MTNDFKNVLKELMNNIAQINYVKPEDIPNINLYMDQVTTFMEEHLKNSKRYEEDKVLTKTMINNYSKNNLLPPSEKKRYSKEHVLILIFIYYFKNILSIKDIETLLDPITQKYFANEDGLNITSIYQEVLELEKSRIDGLAKDIVRSFQTASRCFNEDEDMDDEDREYLQMFAFICNLIFDVYVKKLLMQKLIDELPAPDSNKKKKKKN